MQSSIKQQSVYGQLPFDVPKQGVLLSASWMERISSGFFILPQFIPSAFAFSFTSFIFILHPFVIFNFKARRN